MNKISPIKNTLLLFLLLGASYLFFGALFFTSWCGWGDSMSTLGCQFSNHLAWTVWQWLAILVLVILIIGVIVNYIKKFLTVKGALLVVIATIVAILPITGVYTIESYNQYVREQAIADADPARCDHTLLESGLIERCKFNATKNIGDVNKCADIGWVYSIQCYQIYSREETPAFCETITSGDGKDTCYRTVAGQERNKDLCSKITNTRIQSLCEVYVDRMIKRDNE